AALSARARSWLGWLRQVPDEGRPASFMADLGHTTAVRRAHHAHRRGLLCTSLTDLERRLQEVADGPPARGSSRLRPGTRQRLVLVFPGQGSQWPGMGRDLLTSEPAFRRQMERCDAVIRRLEGWSILDRLAAGEEVAASASIARIQPLLFALQVSLAALWRHWGIEPDAVIGHSMGEVAAAQVAGALSLEDAARVICRRSHLLERLSGDGGMLLAEGTAEEAEAWVAEAPEPVSLAAINGPRSTVLSGPPAALDAMAARLEGRGVYHRRIRVDVASHSPQVEPLARPLLQDLAAIEPSAGTVPIYSTVSATVVSGAELDAEYWQRNLRQPVRFWPVIERLVESGHDTFVEVSPHPSLGSSVEDGLRSTGSPGLVVGSLRREENGRSAMLESLGQLYEAGHPVRWQALHGDGRPLALPTYPWQRQRFWLEEVAGRRTTQPAAEFGASADAHAALYEVVWRQASTGPQPVPAASGGWLILADRTGLAETLAENLAAPRVVVLAGGSFEALGDDRYRLDPAAPEQFERLLEVPVVRRCHHVLYLWSLDVDAAADAASGTAAERTWLGVLHLVQALVSVDSPPRLWLVTRGAQAVDPVSPASLNQAALWGLARVVAAEHPELRTTRIDLGPPTGAKMEAASAEVTALAAELTEARLTEIQRPSEVALRDGQRSTPHLQPVGESGRPIPIRRRASYLITGGLGSLGLEVAAWLVEQGARHLVLLGRHGPGPSAEQRIAALEERGAQVVTASADVARAEDLERAVDLALQDLPPLAGLVHAAGVIDDGSIRSQDAERCRRVMAPKVLGAANLHRLTLGLELDFFVLFSSVASLLGLPGQPAYAAANAGLDHLAHQRRAQGLPATSIHWSGWSGLGFAASEGGRNILAYLARQGLGSLTQDEALRALGRALTVGSPAEIAVLRIDTETYTEFHRQARGNPLLATLGGKGEPSVAAADSEDLRQRLTAIASPQRRRAELESYLQQQAAAVLGLEPSRVGRDDAMRDLGMGSLMAVELRSRLEEGTGLTLSTTLVFSQPTVRQLAAYLGAEMGLGLGGVRAEGEPTEHDRP
ncbi:MAG: SDR family NAD(P)-dependent oxidoreductase, partial [Acidobacteriota bacterium]